MKLRLKKSLSFILTLALLFSASPFSYAVTIGSEYATKTAVAQTEGGSSNLSKDIIQSDPQNGRYKIKLTVGNQSQDNSSAIVLVLDNSGSMESYLNDVKAAATQFVNNTYSEFTDIAVVTFGEDADLVSGFNTDKNDLLAAIGGYEFNGEGTNMQAGIHKARELLDGSSATHKFIVLLGDGIPTFSYSISNYEDLDSVRPNKTWRVYPDYMMTAKSDNKEYIYYSKNGNYLSSTFKYYFRKTTDAVKEADMDYTKIVGDGLAVGGLYVADNQHFWTQLLPPYEKDVAHTIDMSKQAIAESGFAKDDGVIVYSIGFNVDQEAQGILEEIANPGKYYNSDASNLSDVYDEVSGDIYYTYPNPIVIDPIGDSFNLNGGGAADIDVNQGTVSYDSVSETITWNIGNYAGNATMEYDVIYDGDFEIVNPNVTEFPTNGTTTLQAENNIYEEFTVPNVNVKTITYRANGGAGDNMLYGYLEGYTAQVKDNMFTAPAGKVFAGWNTSGTGSGTPYSVNQDITVDSNITLFAIWDDEPVSGRDIVVRYIEVDPDTIAHRTITYQNNSGQDVTINPLTANYMNNPIPGQPDPTIIKDINIQIMDDDYNASDIYQIVAEDTFENNGFTYQYVPNVNIVYNKNVNNFEIPQLFNVQSVTGGSAHNGLGISPQDIEKGVQWPGIINANTEIVYFPYYKVVEPDANVFMAGDDYYTVYIDGQLFYQPTEGNSGNNWGPNYQEIDEKHHDNLYKDTFVAAKGEDFGDNIAGFKMVYKYNSDLGQTFYEGTNDSWYYYVSDDGSEPAADTEGNEWYEEAYKATGWEQAIEIPNPAGSWANDWANVTGAGSDDYKWIWSPNWDEENDDGTDEFDKVVYLRSAVPEDPTPQTVVFTANSDTKVYIGSEQTVTGYTHNAGNGITFSGISASGSGTDVGNYAVTFENEPATVVDDNGVTYNASYVDGNLEITKAPANALILTAEGHSGYYDGGNYAVAASVAPQVAADTTIQYSINGGTTWSIVAPTIENVGYELVDVKAENPNYETATAQVILEVIPRPVTLTSGDATKVYDGTALTNDTVTVGGSGFVDGQGATYNVIGTQTDVGSSANEFTYTLNSNTDANNYDITTTFGTLTVNKATITVNITGNNETFVYDGSSHVVEGFDYDNKDKVTIVLSNGEVAKAERIDVGTTYMGLAPDMFEITSPNYYVTLSITDGFVNITTDGQNIIQVKANSASKEYDKTPLTDPNYTYTGSLLDGHTMQVEIQGSQTIVGSSANTVESVKIIDANGQDVTNNYSFDDDIDGTLTVTARNVTVTSDGASKTYDGTALTNPNVTVTSGTFVDAVNIYTTGSQTEVGSSPNTIVIEPERVLSNYNITKIEGTLTVSSVPYYPPEDPEEILDDKTPLGKLNKEDQIAYIYGYPDGSVRPNGFLAREEAAAVFYRLMKADYRAMVYMNVNSFVDVPKNRWSVEDISTLANAGILHGYADGTFRPYEPIKRGELAIIAANFEGLEENANHNFTDISGTFAEPFIASAAKRGWVEPDANGKFRPNDNITRAEFVTFVNNVMGWHVKKENILPGVRVFTDLTDDNAWYYTAMRIATNTYEYNQIDDEYQKWTKLLPIQE